MDGRKEVKLMSKKNKMPYISPETQQRMFDFFMKTSAPRIYKEEQDKQRKEGK